MEGTEKNTTPLWTRAVAVIVLALAAWMLLKLVIGAVTAIAWIVAAVVAVVGVLWAMSVLRR